MSSSGFGRAVLLAAAVWSFAVTVARADDDVLRIGILTDMSSVFTDLSGVGSVTGAQMAVDDFGGKVGNRRIEVLSADMQNQPDIGVALARKWIDVDKVDIIADVPSSSVALAVSAVVKQKNKIFIASGNISSRFSGDACSPNTVHWAIDTYAMAKSSTDAIIKAGGDSWYFVTGDIASGRDMEEQTSLLVKAAGGKVVGSVRHPLDAQDFSQYIVQAQSSKAKVIAFLSGGSNIINEMKQSEEFSLSSGGQKVVTPFAYITEIHAIGLKAAQGTLLAGSFYWDLNDGTRAFSQRFSERRNGRVPTEFQAGVYSAVTHALKAIAALGDSTDGKAVVAKMKELPTDDLIYGRGYVRADGQKIHPLHLFQVKTPAESHGEWDLYKLLNTIPPERAWRPMSEGGCPLVGG